MGRVVWRTMGTRNSVWLSTRSGSYRDRCRGLRAHEGGSGKAFATAKWLAHMILDS